MTTWYHDITEKTHCTNHIHRYIMATSQNQASPEIICLVTCLVGLKLKLIRIQPPSLFLSPHSFSVTERHGIINYVNELREEQMS